MFLFYTSWKHQRIFCLGAQNGNIGEKCDKNIIFHDKCTTWSYIAVGQRRSSLIINFEQVIKSLFFWNIYFTFFTTSWLHFFTTVLKSNFMEI